MDSYKILIIEDSEEDVFAYKRYLKKMDGEYDVVNFKFAEKGLEYLEHNQVDCILLDYQLPDMSGVEFIEKISGMAKLETSPVVMLTGSGNEKVAVQALKAGAADYLIKGEINIDSLYRAISNAIEKASLLKKVKEQEEVLKHMAYNDNLTGIPNRTKFKELADRSIARTDRKKESSAVMMLDLDGFKAVNDTFGHDVGDEVLIAVTKKYQSMIRKNDTIARLGGDEFAIFLEYINTEKLEVLAGKLIAAAESVANIKGNEVSISCSIGIALFPRDGSTLEELLKKADLALYQAKHNGKGRYEVYAEV